MRRRILIAVLALGTLGGYTSGVASLRYRSQCRRAWMEERAARTCAPCPTSAESPAGLRAEAPTPSEPR
ncbi:hypothetical protein [Hyalangium gracile]|uniref:hypothetical protein n=1 Tax=Hyalangium gracile TaxID=394092 RepID=UPI001CCD1CC1|nr:hypothetical protein [Hyalangium gracile]